MNKTTVSHFSQILLTEEFVERMLEDLDHLNSPEEVSLLNS